uniref:Uncharacterized protein n=1 Tax=Romanomermis culicivorax TaxID=13658 RepID=A0A915HZL3_ROMCU
MKQDEKFITIKLCYLQAFQGKQTIRFLEWVQSTADAPFYMTDDAKEFLPSNSCEFPEAPGRSAGITNSRIEIKIAAVESLTYLYVN